MKTLNELDPGVIQPVTALILDVDGVLTNGGIQYASDGQELKTFHVRDGSGIKYWCRAGHQAALLSGRESSMVALRATELGIETVVMGAKDKLPALEGILKNLQVSVQQCAYVGDDLPDIPVLRAVGLGIAVADAAEEVKETALAVTERPGGAGAVREVVEFLLKAQGRWDGILARYLP